MERMNKKILPDGRTDEDVSFSDSPRRLRRLYRADGSLHFEHDLQTPETKVLREFYPSGALKGETHYFRNMRHGRCVRYSPKGGVLFESILTHGSGEVKEYNDSGSLVVEFFSEEGGRRQMHRSYLPTGHSSNEYWIGNRKVTRKKYMEQPNKSGEATA